MNTTTTLAGKFKTLFSTFNKGVRDVSVSDGKVKVLVSSRKSALGIIRDMGMSRAFSSLGHETSDRGIWIVGTVKA